MTESAAPTTSPKRAKSRMKSVMTLDLHSDIAHDYVRSHIPPDPDAKSQPGLDGVRTGRCVGCIPTHHTTTRLRIGPW